LHDSRRPAGLPKPSRPLRNDQRWQISLRKCRENWNLTCEIGNSKLILTTNTPLISESRWIPTPSILENSPTCCFLEFSPNNPFKIIHYSGSKPRRPGYPFHHLQRSFLAEVPPSSIQTSQQSLRIGRLQGFGSRAAEDTWGTGPHRGQQDLPEGWKGQNCCGKVVLNLTINYLCFEEIFLFECWYYIILYTYLYCNDIKSNIVVMWWGNRFPPRYPILIYTRMIQHVTQSIPKSTFRTTEKGFWKMLFLPEVTIFSFRMKQIRGIKCASQAFSFSSTYDSQSWNNINKA
jgi:hypothetical protein